MKKLILISGAAAICFAGTVAAQPIVFEGAEVSFTNFDSSAGLNGQHIRASGEVSFARFGVQVDIDDFDLDRTSLFKSYTMHVNYDVREAVTSGAFYVYENWDGDKYEVRGFETRYTSDLSTVDIAVGQGVGIGSNYLFVFVDVDIEYDLGNGFSALGNYVTAGGSEDLKIYGFGVRYERAGYFAEATLDQFSDASDQEVIGLEVGYSFGGGTTFDSRDWSGVMGLY